MAATPADKFESVLTTLDGAAEAGEVSSEDRERIRELCAAYDPEDATADLPRDLYDRNRRDGHKKYGTLTAWASRLTTAARDLDLTTASARDINTWTTAQGKSDGSPGWTTVNGIEYALKKFYRYHADLDVGADDITVHDAAPRSEDDGAGWDARHMLDADERRALRTVADHPRDLAIYHLLLYTGLRNTALRTLRVGDIELESHEWYFNTSADGLKDIDKPRDPRPLFQAERAVRDWLEYHPTGNDEDYFITGKPKYAAIDATTPVSHETIRRVMKTLKERTADRADLPTVEKPCHPHMARHNFVTMARRHPDISDADIKFYLGHSAGSNVMETTYGHLSSEDHNQSGHGAFGVGRAADGADDLDPWDTTCPHCDRVLHPAEDACAVCGEDRERQPWDAGPTEPQSPFGKMLNAALTGDDDAADALAELVAERMDPEKFRAIMAQNAAAQDELAGLE